MPPTSTPSRRYILRFFAADSANKIHSLRLTKPGGSRIVANNDNPELLRYDAVIRRIAHALENRQPVLSNVTLAADPDTAASERAIDVLLARTDNLCHPSFFYNLSNAPLRPVDPPLGGKSAGTKVSEFVPNPVVTLCPADLLAMYEETTGSEHETEAQTRHWKMAREGQGVLYALGIDHRAKFLDASIWHRYVRTEGDWLPDFASVLTELMHYADLHLYDAPAALATLEFSCRMLQHSFIANFSDRGHQEAVTPFKFHSETVMAQKARKMQETFFEKIYENGSRLADLRWNVLMVDDYAHRKLVLQGATTKPGGNGDISHVPTKKEIIESALSVSPEFNLADNLHIEITRDESKVISKAIELLKNPEAPGFDIIMLDYLLGESEVCPQSGLKAYGHEFLLELATSDERHSFRRGPMGRYWIFPISSFPFAFSDKLRQMNLDSSTEMWHIAAGGDPISTPALFRVNFMRLLIRQIGEFYLHDAALERWLDRFERIQTKQEWADALRRQIAADLTKSNLLALERKGHSAFGVQMERFLSQQPMYAGFWASLEGWLQTLDRYQAGEPTEVLFAKLDELLPAHWSHMRAKLHNQLNRIVRNATIELKEHVSQLKAKGNNSLVFKAQNLFCMPDNLHQIHPDINAIDLSDNDLVIFSIKPGQWPDLTKLDLSNNKDLYHLSVAELLKRKLYEINLTGTKISTLLGRHDLYAFDLQSTRNLLQSLPPANGNTSKFPLKVFVGNAPVDIGYREKLVAHLSMLSRIGQIDVWHEGLTLPGQDQVREREKALHKADVVLYLVSSDLFADPRMKQDEKIAQERCHKGLCHVIPIYLRRCDTMGHWLDPLQGLPEGKDHPITESHQQDKSFSLVAAALRHLIQEKYLGA